MYSWANIYPLKFFYRISNSKDDNDKRKIGNEIVISNYNLDPIQEEFDFRNGDPDKKRRIEVCSGILPKGSLVVFPSFVWHRVRPVLRGTRRSLVIWNLGRAFK